MSVFTNLGYRFPLLGAPVLRTDLSYGYSYYLGWISMAISFILSIVVQLTRFLKLDEN